MSRISRITAQIFAGSATNNGQFGSAQVGTKVTSTSLTTLMGLPAWAQGWLSSIMGSSKFPPLEELQSVEYVHSTQIAYLLSQGVAEYDAGTTYYQNQVCMNPGTFQLWGSLVNANIGNALVAGSNWQLLADFSAASLSTGDAKLTFKTTADAGWIIANDGSIGSASSGATTRANADTVALYTLFWNNISNTYCPVAGGRGGSAAADFAANKALTIPAMLGRALAISGSGAGLTSRALGQTFGEEGHALTSGENGSHTHTATFAANAHFHSMLGSSTAESGSSAGGLGEAGIKTMMGATNAGGGSITYYATDPTNGTQYVQSTTETGSVTVNSSGSGTAHNTMQPTSFLNVMIKL